jgi:hypothetical protein
LQLTAVSNALDNRYPGSSGAGNGLVEYDVKNNAKKQEQAQLLQVNNSL